MTLENELPPDSGRPVKKKADAQHLREARERLRDTPSPPVAAPTDVTPAIGDVWRNKHRPQVIVDVTDYYTLNAVPWVVFEGRGLPRRPPRRMPVREFRESYEFARRETQQPGEKVVP